MTLTPSKPTGFVLSPEESQRAQSVLNQMIRDEERDVERPPVSYIVLGMREITASQSLSYNRSLECKRFTVVPIVKQPDVSPAEDDALAEETAEIVPLLAPGAEWRYSGYALYQNLQALREGRLVFANFRKKI